MLRNLAGSLFERQAIETTADKAKAVKPILDKLVNLAKDGSLASYRRGIAMVHKRAIVKKLFRDVKDGSIGQGRASGYVSSARTRLRRGDNAQMVRLTLITPGYQKAAAGAGAASRARRVAASRAKGSPPAAS
jgi:large subunit ribosomal protein L17